MATSSDDTAELTVDLNFPPTQPPSVDPAVLRRALKYGQKVRVHFPNLSFWNVEPELEAGWLSRGETTEWEWVRAAVRAGYEQEPNDEL